MLNNFWWITETFLESILSSNVTEKNLSTMFSKFAVEKALMLEFNIACIANLYFASDYVNCK